MGLNGRALPIVLGVLAVAVLALIVSGRPAPRSRPIRMMARGGLTLTFTALVLALVAALFNNEYAFYSSWSDLVGAPTKESQVHYGSTAAFGAGTLAAGPLTHVATPALLPPLSEPGARLQHYTLAGPREDGASSTQKRTVIVRLPKGYDPSRAATYPVIMAMHGLPATPKSYATVGGFYDKLDAAEASGAIRPSIVVIPQLNPSPRSDNECIDWPGGDQTETWLARELPAWAKTHFKVADDRGSWATWGYSYGGWCASMIAMKHPETFGAAVVFQGYYRAEFTGPSPLPAGSALAKSYDLAALERRSAPPVSLWIFASQSDGASYPSTRRFLHEVKAPTSVTAFIGKGGGHRLSVWTRHIPTTFAWLGQTLQGFAPQGRSTPQPPTGSTHPSHPLTQADAAHR